MSRDHFDADQPPTWRAEYTPSFVMIHEPCMPFDERLLAFESTALHELFLSVLEELQATLALPWEKESQAD